MSAETTVLLLEADLLPSTLEEQLTKRDVFVEHATTATIAQMLPVVVPDLVVQSGDVGLEAVLKSLRDGDGSTPLVVIADRAAIRRLRAEKHDEVKALIPKDLPIAAVAHRLSTMARRSAEGRPLERTQQRQSAKVSRPRAEEAAAPISAPPETGLSPGSERGSLAPRPLAPHQEVKILDSDPEAQKLREQEERERLAMIEAEAQQRAVVEERRKKLAAAEQRTREVAEKRRAEIEARAQERKKKLEAQKKEREARAVERKEAQAASLRPAARNTPSEVKALDELFPTEMDETPEVEPVGEAAAVAELEETTQAVNISAFAPALDAQAKRDSSSAPTRPAMQSSEPTRPARTAEVTADDAFDAVKKQDELSVIMPLPVELRLPLAPDTGQLPEIRLALLDTDLTRADAVSAALRERGMKIHPVTPDTQRTRWPMLRRFAPQGLIVDEKSMARGAAEWVETFRGDPFLRHVPVVLVRFSRLFDEQSTGVTLEPLLHMIEHIGREEFALLEKLGPGKQVDLWLSQLAPYRLVQMLTQEDRNTRLDCKSRDERMVWHLGPGYAGKGKLADLKSGAPKARLSPEDSLAWLLGHEDCQVAVHEHAEPLAHASESKDSEELLREMTEALAAPTRHESVRPGAFGEGPPAPSVPQSAVAPSAPANGPPAQDSVPTLSSSALLSEKAVPEAPPPPMRAGDGARQNIPKTRSPLLSPAQREKIRALVFQSKASVVRAYAIYRGKLENVVAPLASRVPEKVLRHAHWALPLLVLCVFMVLVLAMSGGDGPAEPGAQAQLAAPEKKEPALAEKQSPPQKVKPEEAPAPDEEPAKAEESGTDLWKVAPDTNLETCEARLGASVPKSEDPIKSVGYWKNARRLLMVGKTAEAIENMCLAGLFDPGGPASEGLAEYYLGQRSLKEAERWIKLSLKADPERRKSQELRGDIENQKGNVEESRKLLLDTLRLTGDETKKMDMTARKLRQDAALARKGGDLPRAERELRRAVLLSPKDAVLAAELGEVLLRRSAAEGAARWAAQALKLDPNYSVAMLLAGRVAEARGKKDEARTAYEMVPIGDPFHQEAQRRRSRL